MRTNTPTSDDHLGVPALRATIPPVATLAGEPLPDDLVALSAEPAGVVDGVRPKALDDGTIEWTVADSRGGQSRRTVAADSRGGHRYG